ncbi:hypothetical protein PVAND_004554 [Polypedilum vanderplanki]|uniref:Peroxisomal membrane protein 11B n=1 Tax=Polypedilum vanderplanki TaxID=319348 RepID=A0A9J6BY30_POLVA|nr:hypothetical protein PVAND_004554 [Polypedilum vanderplanki]
MDIVIKLNSQVAGKDKVARLIQYSCRALWDSLNQKDESQIALIHQLKNLEFILSSFRKLLRFGKSFEVFYSSLKSIHYSDAWIAFTSTVTKICQAIFLLTDHIIWLSRSGLFKNIDTPKWSQRSNRYWVVSLIMSIIRDVYEINRVISSFTSYKDLTQCIASSMFSIRSTKDITRCASSLAEFLVTYKHITIDTIKNVCDLFIPLNGLGYTKLSPKVIGLLGVISSLMGLIVVLDPSCKLLPQ